ncbi:C-type lectin lectoxin-Phi1-like [Haliotis rubra]|uniref:C-type lectin lectoxin-Phi1-like n=1 Tax=Haliotis rubra TaxID=36100 RepID=UPI001EE52AB4|nr:C-type lectin lectoxin-Phi1-like [Haliotis rubra]
MDATSTAAVICWLVMSIAGGCICGRSFYRRIESLDNMEVTASASTTQTIISSLGQCARLCRQQDCVYLRHEGDVCSLYDVLVTVSSSPAHGAIYYRETCPTGLGYVFAESANLCFKVSPASDTKDWEESLNACRDDGGRLAVIDTDARHIFFKTHLSDGGVGTDTVWVGMNKSTTSGPFRWLTGSTHTTQWDAVEPDYVSYQNCVYLYYKNLVDTECNSQRRRLCEFVL